MHFHVYIVILFYAHLCVMQFIAKLFIGTTTSNLYNYFTLTYIPGCISITNMIISIDHYTQMITHASCMFIINLRHSV